MALSDLNKQYCVLLILLMLAPSFIHHSSLGDWGLAFCLWTSTGFTHEWRCSVKSHSSGCDWKWFLFTSVL